MGVVPVALAVVSLGILGYVAMYNRQVRRARRIAIEPRRPREIDALLVGVAWPRWFWMGNGLVLAVGGDLVIVADVPWGTPKEERRFRAREITELEIQRTEHPGAFASNQARRKSVYVRPYTRRVRLRRYLKPPGLAPQNAASPGMLASIRRASGLEHLR